MLKRMSLVFMSVLLCSTLQAQGYFCSRKGARLEYVRKYAETDRIRWRHVMTVTDVTEDGLIATSSDFLKANGKKLYRGSVLETTKVDASTGNVYLDMGQALASYITARTGIHADGYGGLAVLPAGLQPGDTLPQVQFKAGIGPVTYTVTVYSRKALRYETVRVPAGRFDCIVIREYKNESGPGHNRRVMNDSWYCKGVGYVRHDTYDSSGKLETSELLYSIQ